MVLSLSNTQPLKPAAASACQSTWLMSGTETCGSASGWLVPTICRNSDMPAELKFCCSLATLRDQEEEEEEEAIAATRRPARGRDERGPGSAQRPGR